LGRRKKAKPTKKLLFDDEEDESVKTIIVSEVKEKEIKK
jgi:hypothetical protein